MANAAPKARRLWLARLSGILLLVVLGFVITRRGEELRFADLLTHAQPGWLVLAVLLQIGTYACAAGAWRRVLSAAVVGLLGFHLAYGLALLTALVLLALSGDLGHRMLSLTIVATFLIIAMIVAMFWLAGGRRGPVQRLLIRIPGLKGFLQERHDAPREALHDTPLLLQTMGLQFGIFVLDAATLGVCLAALGATASVTGLFAALVIASLVATITIIPSGLGTFDAAMLAMLHLVGVSTTHGVAAVLLFPGFTVADALGYAHDVEGETLRTRLTREKQLPVDDTLQAAQTQPRRRARRRAPERR